MAARVAMLGMLLALVLGGAARAQAEAAGDRAEGAADAPVELSLPPGVQVSFPDRSVGYFIGDVLVQRITADEPLQLPASFADGQRVDDYLFRLAVAVPERPSNVAELRYQVINAPRETRTIALPRARLLTASGEPLELPAWSFGISPISPAAAEMLPDRSALATMEAPDAQRLQHTLMALGAVLGLWLAWWLYRKFRDAHVMPFARARRTIARLPAAQRQSSPEVWVALHHAFNAVAGRAIGAAGIERVFEAAPWLDGQRNDIEDFFRASDQRFFGQAETDPGVDAAALARSLYTLEKRHASGAPKWKR